MHVERLRGHRICAIWGKNLKDWRMMLILYWVDCIEKNRIQIKKMLKHINHEIVSLAHIIFKVFLEISFMLLYQKILNLK